MLKISPDVSGRVNKLREKVLLPPSICLERGELFTQSYKETEGQPEVIRKAKALAKVLSQMTVRIDDDELIVGTPTSKERGAVLTPEVQWEWYIEEMDDIATRDWDRFMPISDSDKSKMRGFLPWWKGKALYDRWRAMLPQDALKLNNILQAGVGYANNNQYYGHIAPHNEKLLAMGLNGIKKEVDEQLTKLNLADLKDLAKYHFYTAINISLDAVISYARRYADLAAKMAAKETNARRKAELQKIAEMCNWVPANPARSFYEALQSMWLVWIPLMIEGWGPSVGFGRPDQYLYPIYKKDLDAGKITRDQARELIALLYIKIGSAVIPYPTPVARSYAGLSLACNLILGGVTKDGRDAVNDLTYVFLDAEADARLHSEDLVVRIHKNNPDAYVMKACEVAKLLRGKIKFMSDETTIQQLLGDGKPIELARDYIITGCNSPGVQAASLDIPGGIVNLPLLLELALNNGVWRMTGEQIGPRTGDARKFKSYEEVWGAFKAQVEALVPTCLMYKNADKQLFGQYAPLPFQSSLTIGCVEKGLDITNGGTYPYLTNATSLGGSPNVGDALAAIKRAVFEDNKITMSQLIDALEKNFEGEEKLLHVLESCPKFGNDDDFADSMVNDVLMCARDAVARTRGYAGALSTSAGGTITANIPLGHVVGALPDGRKAGMPFADGGLSPVHGRNVNGPTATMRSVAKLDLVKLSHGSVLNMRFNPDVLKDEQKMRKFAALIRTYCETGGDLVQFNIVGSETLREAKKNPEKYKDLLVRVATYSAYFVELSPELQDDIIHRTEFEEI